MSTRPLPPTLREQDADDLQTIAVLGLAAFALFRVGLLVGRRR